MKRTTLILTAAIILAPMTSQAWDNGSRERQIRTRFSADIAPAGSILNPYVITDDRGNETVLRPRYIENPCPDDPDFAPGGLFNPLEADN